MMPEWFLDSPEAVDAYMEREDVTEFAAVGAAGDLLLVYRGQYGDLAAQGVPVGDEEDGTFDRGAGLLAELGVFPLAVLGLSEPETWEAMKA